MDERTAKIQELFSDKAFVEELCNAEDEVAVQKMLADKGVEMSLTEIDLMSDILGKMEDGEVTKERLERLANPGELSEEELAEVAGGGFFADKVIEYYDNLGNILSKNLATAQRAAGREIHERVLSVSYNTGNIVGTCIAGAVAVAGIGIGVYDAIRRRW